MTASVGVPLDYCEAVQRVTELRAGCGCDLNPDCRPILMDHGAKAPAAVVWLHGYTNCPRQFESLGRACFEAGYNVYIPLAPNHGLADRMTKRHSRNTPSILRRFAEESVDIAHGLGERVAVGGLSMGGALTSWLAARRPDIDLAIPIAPLYSPFAGPLWRARLIALTLSRVAPNVMVWWSSARKGDLEGPRNAYLRYSTRGIGHVMRLGLQSMGPSASRALAARRIHYVLNDNDEAVDNSLAKARAAVLSNMDPGRAGLTVFPKEMRLVHDLIDPLQSTQKVDRVYPVILDIIRREIPV